MRMIITLVNHSPPFLSFHHSTRTHSRTRSHSEKCRRRRRRWVRSTSGPNTSDMRYRLVPSATTTIPLELNRWNQAEQYRASVCTPPPLPLRRYQSETETRQPKGQQTADGKRFIPSFARHTEHLSLLRRYLSRRSLSLCIYTSTHTFSLSLSLVIRSCLDSP
jgi:hypothetical protein